MECQNTGPWHLGISEEACENAGGKWFRTPCITLKEAIDGRVPKFDLDAPVDSTCQDALQRSNIAYVSSINNHINFTHTNDKHGCNKFCGSLPDYSNQLAMYMVSLLLGGVCCI